MPKLSIRQVTGLLLISVPILFMGCFTLLQIQFEYPAILRQPTASVLAKFQAGGLNLIATWYIITLAALLFIPISILLHHTLAQPGPSALRSLALVCGIVAGLVQALGLIRWPFLVPHLAEIYSTPGHSAAQRETAAVVFEAFHRYAGMAIGEQLGYLCTSLWTALIGIVLLRSADFRPWLGVSGIVLSVGVAIGMLEMAGVAVAGTINAISYMGWSIWLMILGAQLLARRPAPPLFNAPAQGGAAGQPG